MSQQSENQNPTDTTYTKIYVGGLAWATKEEGLGSYFEQFGEIIHLNIVYERQTGRSKGFGFVTFKDAESATRACVNPNPIIEGRTTNCKLASSGDTVNHNQSNQTVWLNQPPPLNLHQPLPIYVGNSWNQGYPCYHPQHSYHYDPQYDAQFYPQYYPESYQFYPMVDTNPTHWPHQYVNDSGGN